MRIPFLACFFLSSLAISVLVWPAWPQNKGVAGFRVVVQPEAAINVEAITSPDYDDARQGALWFRVDLAVRLNPGATADLFLQQGFVSAGPGKQVHAGGTDLVQTPGAKAPERGEIAGSRPLFSTQRNGQFSLFVGIERNESVGEKRFVVESIQFVLGSSDGSFRLTRSVSVKDETEVPEP